MTSCYNVLSYSKFKIKKKNVKQPNFFKKLSAQILVTHVIDK